MLRVAATVIGTLILLGTVSPRASADGGVGVGGCADFHFCVGVETPAKPGDGGSKPSHSAGDGDATPVASLGAVDCNIRRLEPQPPAGSALWEGHTPGDGAVYVNPCINRGPGAANGDTIGLAFWSKATPDPAVSPAVLAQRAVDSMLLTGPAVASPRADGTYTVGVPLWMWVSQSPTTWGPNTASASAGGITVTATATVSSVAWNMGDGTTVTCIGPGTPYTAARGMTPSPDCGHRYSATSAGQSGARYQGTATATWTVNWAVTGGGQSGRLTEVRQTPFTVSVGELQVVGQ